MNALTCHGADDARNALGARLCCSRKLFWFNKMEEGCREVVLVP